MLWASAYLGTVLRVKHDDQNITKKVIWKKLNYIAGYRELWLFAFSSFNYITFFGSCTLLFSKLALLDKVLFSDFCQTGTKDSFFQILGWDLLLSVKLQTGIGCRGNRMHFSLVHIFVFDSQQDHFDSLCLAIIQSFSASCVDASYQIFLYTVCTYTFRNSLLGLHLNICVKISLTGRVD